MIAVKFTCRVLLLMLAAGISAVAQPTSYFRNLTVSDGLPSNFITVIQEDQHGYKWLGTLDGLVRFDGHTFEQFLHDPSDSTSIGFNHIGWDISEDDLGRIWISLYGQGFSRYEPETGLFTSFTFANGRLAAKWADHVQNFMFASDGTVYINCVEGILKLSDADQVEVVSHVKQQPDLEKMGDLRVATLVDDRWIWCSSTKGLARYDILNDSWEYHANTRSDNPAFNSSWIMHSAKFQAGQVWFTTFLKPKGSDTRFLYRYDLHSTSLDSVPIVPSLRRVQPFSDVVHAIQVGKDGSIQLATEDLGLLEYTPKSKQWKQQRSEGTWSGDLPKGPVKVLFEDADNNLWVGTESGLSILGINAYFTNYATSQDASGRTIGLTGIRAMAADPAGGIWLGKESEGLYHLNSERTVTQTIRAEVTNPGEKPNYHEPMLVHQDKLIYHVWFDGLRSLKPGTGQVSRIPAEVNDEKSELRKVFSTKNGQLYASGWGQFGKLDIEPASFANHETLQAKRLNKDFVLDLQEGDGGEMWLAFANGGLASIDPTDNSIVDHWYRDTTKFPTTTIWNLLIDGGKAFFSVQGEGLWVMDLKTKNIQTYGKHDGLCSNNINGLIKDSSGEIWIYSSAGLSWFNAALGGFRTFTETDGMLSQQIRDAELLSDGKILLVTDQGLVEFNPEKLKQTIPTEKPFIRSIQVFDEEIDLDELGEGTKEVVIPHNRNYLRAQFTAMEFFDPERIRFAYRLEGIEHEWNYTKHQPVAIYSNLRGGQYNLCVKRTNVHGEWGPELCVPLFVTTPVYLQLWFIVLASLVLIALVYWIYRWQWKKRMAVIQVRNRVSQDLHDDIGSTLSSINIFSSVAKEQLGATEPETAELLQHISEGAEDMMQNMDDIVWAINPTNDQLTTLQSRMLEYAVPIIESKGIVLETELIHSKNNIKLGMEKRKNIFLIFKESVNNLVKHSGADRAWIRLTLDGGLLRWMIRDDGVGFDPLKPTNRNGLKNMRSRIDEIGGRIEIDSAGATGTRISIVVPVP